MKHVGCCCALAMWGTLLAGTAGAQAAPPAGVQVTVAPAFQTWRFGKDVRLDTLLVSGASQVSLPFVVQFPLRTRWTASVSGAAATSRLDARGNDSVSSVTRTFTGLSDLRVRATGRMFGDALQFTFGLNVPTGTVNLSPEQNDVVRVTAAPALDARVPIAGTGLGGTVGVILARMVGEWAWAVGAGYEQRGRYSPLDAQIAGFEARTELEPGGAGHVSVGADGLLGAHRLSIGVVGDLYGSDRLHLASQGSEPQTERYRLGPTISGALALELNNPRVRNLVLTLSERYRSGFRDANDVDVEGSSGNYLEAGITGLVGPAGRPALLLGLGVRQHSGLPVDQGFIGAGLTAVGVTVGASLPSAALDWRPSVQVTAGSLRTARVTTSMTGITVGLAVNAR